MRHPKTCSAGLFALVPVLLATSCPTDSPQALRVEVHATGSGSGTVTSGELVHCTVAAGVQQGVCEYRYSERNGSLFYQASPSSGSTFVGWVGDDPQQPSTDCRDAASTICELLDLGQTGSIVLRPHFSAGAEGMLIIDITPHIGDVGVTSADGRIDCSDIQGEQSDRCWGWFAIGTQVDLHARVAGAPFSNWSGCDIASNATRDCSVVIDTTRTVRVGASLYVQVSGAGTGAGTVTSTPSGITCIVTASITSGRCYESVPTWRVSLAAQTSAGSTFVGWSGDCSGTGACDLVMVAPASVTATFAAVVPATFPLTVAIAGAGQGTVTSSPVGISCSNGVSVGCTASYASGTMITLTATPGTSSVFSGWSGGGCLGNGTCTVTISAATTVTATFAVAPPATFPLTVTFTGMGTANLNSLPPGIDCTSTAGVVTGTCTANFPAGSVVTLDLDGVVQTLVSVTGCVLGGAGHDECPVTMNGPVTVAVTLSPSVFPLTVTFSGTGTANLNSRPAGIDCTSTAGLVTGTCTASFPAGSTVTLDLDGVVQTLVSVTGCVLGGAGHDECPVTMNGPVTIAVTLTPVVTNHQLSVSLAGSGQGLVTSSPAGINCYNFSAGPGPSVCATTYSAGTQVTLTATPNGMFAFTGWTGAGCTGTGTCVVTMGSAQSVQASFGMPSFTLTVTGAGTGTGTVTSVPAIITCTSTAGVTTGTCASSFEGGQLVTLIAAPASGSAFAGWSSGIASCTGATSVCFVPMNAAAQVTVTFDTMAGAAAAPAPRARQTR